MVSTRTTFHKKVQFCDLIAYELIIAWENSRHFATLPLVCPQNDVWGTSAEIPYWWHVTTQIWVLTRHQYGISAFFSQTSLREEIRGSVAKSRLFSQANWSQNWSELILFTDQDVLSQGTCVSSNYLYRLWLFLALCGLGRECPEGKVQWSLFPN